MPSKASAPQLGGELLLGQLGDPGKVRTGRWTQVSAPLLISGDLGKSCLRFSPQASHLENS